MYYIPYSVHSLPLHKLLTLDAHKKIWSWSDYFGEMPYKRDGEFSKCYWLTTAISPSQRRGMVGVIFTQHLKGLTFPIPALQLSHIYCAQLLALNGQYVSKTGWQHAACGSDALSSLSIPHLSIYLSKCYLTPTWQGASQC